MKNETWRPLQINPMKIASISSIHDEALEFYLKAFAHKEFQARGLPQHPVWNAYRDEESKFLRTVRKISMEKIPRNANVITSHVIYKVKVNNDGSLKMKFRTAPQGNRDKDRNILKTDSAQ